VRYPCGFRDAKKRESIGSRYPLQSFDTRNICGRVTLGMSSENPFRKWGFGSEPFDECVSFLDQLGQLPGAVHVHASVAVGIGADQRLVIVKQIDEKGAQYSCFQITDKAAHPARESERRREQIQGASNFLVMDCGVEAQGSTGGQSTNSHLVGFCRGCIYGKG